MVAGTRSSNYVKVFIFSSDEWILQRRLVGYVGSAFGQSVSVVSSGSRIIVTGDLAQHDRGFDNNGLKDFMFLLKKTDTQRIGFTEFSKGDVERHPAVAEVLSIYGDESIN